MAFAEESVLLSVLLALSLQATNAAMDKINKSFFIMIFYVAE